MTNSKDANNAGDLPYPGIPSMAEGRFPGRRPFRPRIPEVGRERRKLEGVSCELGFLNMAAPLSVEVEFG